MKKRAVMTVQRIRRAGIAAVLLAAASVDLSAGADRAAKIIQDALGIESDDVVNYCFPTDMAD